MKTKKQTTMERYLLLLYASICLTTLMLPVPEQRSLVPLFLASHTVWNKKLEPGRPPAPFVFEAAAVRWRCAPGMTCLPWLLAYNPAPLPQPVRSSIRSGHCIDSPSWRYASPQIVDFGATAALLLYYGITGYTSHVPGYSSSFPTSPSRETHSAAAKYGKYRVMRLRCFVNLFTAMHA